MDFTDDALETYRMHADVCRVLTDPKRLMALDTLRSGERSVGELAAAIGVALPNASQHLAVLRTAGLVEGRRDGTSIVYRLTEPAIVERRRTRPFRPTGGATIAGGITEDHHAYVVRGASGAEPAAEVIVLGLGAAPVAAS